MFWHFQMTRCKIDNDDIGEDEYAYEIREVYHGLDDVPKNELGVVWSSRGVAPYGETREECLRDLQMMLDDAKKYPVLDITNEDYPYLVEVDK